MTSTWPPGDPPVTFLHPDSYLHGASGDPLDPLSAIAARSAHERELSRKLGHLGHSRYETSRSGSLSPRAVYLIESLRLRGISVRLAGDGIAVRPARLVNAQDREDVTRNREQIVLSLRRERLAEAHWRESLGPSGTLRFDFGDTCGYGPVYNPALHVRDIHPHELETFEMLLGVATDRQRLEPLL